MMGFPISAGNWKPAESEIRQFPILSGGSTEGGRAFVPGCRGGSACAECRGGEPLLRCPEVENLGPGKVDVCVNLYWVLPDAKLRRECGFRRPSPAPENL